MRHRDSRGRARRVVSAVCAVVLLLAISTSCSRRAEAAATVTIRLDQTSGLPGVPIKGTATVDNRSGAPVSIAGGICNGWLAVGLGSNSVRFEPVFTLIGCGAFLVPRGVSSYPITVATTYSGCGGSDSATGLSYPRCLPGPGMPPLPPGTYRTQVVIGGGRYPPGHPPVAAANSVTVVLST
jgi:hypothetical protein